MSSTQEIQQKICQKNGLSYSYSQLEDERWRLEVVVGIGDRRTYETETAYKGAKQGKAAVSTIALDDLRLFVEKRYGSLPSSDLAQVFRTNLSQLEILDSHDPRTSWERFWKDPPTVVGIDVEGNQRVPPVLVQIATPDYVILEAPPPNERLSVGLSKLLRDDSIVKVFCDNFSHKDKTCLGLSLESSFTKPPIVDLEALTAELLGPVQVPRGLSRLMTILFPEYKVRFEKPTKGRFANIGRFALIEQGKAPPLRAVSDLSPKEQEYAALDAWCTLRAYQRLQQKLN